MESVKLHLGCGSRHLPGFIHIDCNDLEHLDYCSSIDDLSMFEDGSVDEIYSCGAFGYFDRQAAPAVLAEWHRVLKKGGILRISIVDFEKQVQLYYESGKVLESAAVLGPLYGKWKVADSNGEIKFLYKKTSYDYASLAKILLENGFIDVKRYDWREFLPNDYDDYSRAYVPHMDESGVLIMLNVECIK